MRLLTAVSLVRVQQGELSTKGALHIRLLGQAVKTSPFHGGNTGSIPVGVIRFGLRNQLGRKRHADVAQLAEQLICNQQVIGSSPIIGFGRYSYNMDL